MASTQALLLLLVMKSATSINVKGGPIAKTQYGPVAGMYSDEAAIFFGLPFGMPPVGEMRWKAPQPFNTTWVPHTYNATFPRPGCHQDFCLKAPDLDEALDCPRDGKFSEDCLYLNVFTPLPFNPSDKLPVAIWFPGKRYIYGSATYLLLDGRFLANKTRAVVVTTNYRLGALGFLVAGEGEGAAMGNYGTLDQIAAMQWVQSNIGSFGGDKDQVTIMGQSSGADSVALHLMAENTEHLFKRAVMMSIPFMSHKTRTAAFVLSDIFAELLNCSTGNMTCFRAATPEAILSAQYKATPVVLHRLIEEYVDWGPSIDGKVVQTANLQDMFLHGKFQKKPFIIGTATEDGLPFIYETYPSNIDKTEFEEIMQDIFLDKADLVMNEYPPLPFRDERPAMSYLATHLYYACPARRAIRSATHFNLSDVWLHHFDQTTDAKGVPLWQFLGECYDHVCHGSDVPFLFQTLPLAGVNMTSEEQNTTAIMAHFFGNFINTGDPNNSGWRVSSPFQVSPDGQQQPSTAAIHWPKYNKLNNYVNMKFTAPTSQLEQGYLDEKCDFWDKNFP